MKILVFSLFFVPLFALDPPYGQLKIQGNYVTDTNGTPVQLIGMSLFWSEAYNQLFYNNKTIYHLRKHWNANIVRAAMGIEYLDNNPGYLNNSEGEYAKVKAVIEGAIQHGIYVIVDWHENRADTHIPEDYWLSLLYKKLVGTQVYNLTFDPVDPNLRLYAASSKNINNGIVVYGVKLSNDSSMIDFPNLTTKQTTVYVLKERESGNLLSKTSKLNDVLLKWNSHQPGANYQGVVTSLPITIPGYSHFFIVLNLNTETSCPNGWYKESTSSNKCVKFVTEIQPLFGAKFDCTTFGSNSSITSISNTFENTELLNIVQAQSCSQFYLGLYRNNWTWSNGDSSSYQNWKTGYPTNDNTKNCVIFDAMSGTWFNDDCDKAQCYICQKLV